MVGAWLMIAAGDERQFAGNDGYDDRPDEHYSWDSTVPNHAAVAVGDRIALWDKHRLLGCSVIETITTATAQKTRYRCPNPTCEVADIKARTTTGDYRCGRCHQIFLHPASHQVDVTTYRSAHALGWSDLEGVLDGAQLRQLCLSPQSQHAMRALNWEQLSVALDGVGRPTPLVAAAGALIGADTTIAGGHRTRIVRVRVGQGLFRQQLLARYGHLCAFTGPAPAEALEAAHLYSYAELGQHHDNGGLLLRRDVHRLFDAGQLAINPGDATIDVRGDLHAYPHYAQLHGQLLHLPGQRSARAWLAAHRQWVGAHWQLHREGPTP